MPALIITRTKVRYAKKIPLKVLIDDVEMGTIENGATEVFEVALGTHEVKIGFTQNIKKYAVKNIEAIDKQNIVMTTQVNAMPMLTTVVIGAGGGLLGMGLSKGGLSIAGLVLAIIGGIMAFRAHKKTGGKLCTIVEEPSNP